jgi:hypothetical protein
MVDNSQCLNQGQEKKLIYYEIATFQAQFIAVFTSEHSYPQYSLLANHSIKAGPRKNLLRFLPEYADAR